MSIPIPEYLVNQTLSDTISVAEMLINVSAAVTHLILIFSKREGTKMENTNLNPEMKQEAAPAIPSSNYEILYCSKLIDSDEPFVTLRFHLPV